MPERFQKLLFLAAVLAALSPPARAAGGPGSSSAEFLTIGVGARPASLAESYSGLADDVHALAYNPAGLAFLRRKEIGLDHDYQGPGVYHEWLGYAHPAPWGTVGLAANMLLVRPFESYTDYDNPSGKTSASDAAYQLSYAGTITDRLALGASAKHVSSRLHQASASTFAGDAGVLWTPLPRLSLGASVLNAGPGLRYIAATENLPTTLRGGLSWIPFDPRIHRDFITLSVDADKRRDEQARVGGGLEFCYDDVIAVRAGGRSQPGGGTGLTLGVGFYLFRNEDKGFEVDFDYALVDAGNFSTSHRAGIVVKFGEALPDAERAALIRKSATYYESNIKPKPRPGRKVFAPATRPRPRPGPRPASSAEPEILDRTRYILP